MNSNQSILSEQIAALENVLKYTLPHLLRQEIETYLQELRSNLIVRQTSIPGIIGTAHISGQVAGPVVGVNMGTIIWESGNLPPQDSARYLDDYLASLSNECDQLRLSRLTSRRQTGAEQSSAPPLRLQQVYTSLATDGPEVTVHYRERTVAWLRRILPRLRIDQCSPELCAPEQVRELELYGPASSITDSTHRSLLIHSRRSTQTSVDDILDQNDSMTYYSGPLVKHT